MGQFEFLRQLSSNPANIVIGMVRDVKSTEAKVTTEINRSNVHIIQGDLDRYESLKASLRSPSSQETLLILTFKESERSHRENHRRKPRLSYCQRSSSPQRFFLRRFWRDVSAPCFFSFFWSIRCTTVLRRRYLMIIGIKGQKPGHLRGRAHGRLQNQRCW